MIVQAAPIDHHEWLISRSGFAPTKHLKCIEAVDRTGKIQGMIGYDGWTESSVQLHQAVDSPIAWRSLIHPGFEYPFVQCNRTILIGLTPSKNQRAIEMNMRLGFKETYRIKDACSIGEDMVLFEMRRADCRWLHTTKYLNEGVSP